MCSCYLKLRLGLYHVFGMVAIQESGTQGVWMKNVVVAEQLILMSTGASHLRPKACLCIVRLYDLFKSKSGMTIVTVDQ